MQICISKTNVYGVPYVPGAVLSVKIKANFLNQATRKKKFFFELGGHGNSHQPPEKMWVTSKPLGFASDSLDSVKVSPAWGVQNVGNFIVYVLQSNTESSLYCDAVVFQLFQVAQEFPRK